MIDPCQYTVVRADMDVGKSHAQSGHAAAEAGSLYTYLTHERIPPHCFYVCLTAPNEEELLRLAAKLEGADIPHVVWREPDPPFNGGVTAIGICPQDRAKVARFTARYPLKKEDPK